MRNWRTVLSAVAVAAPMVLGSHLLAWHAAPWTDDSLENSIAAGALFVVFMVLVVAYAAVASIVGGVALKWQRLRVQDIGRGIFIGIALGTVLGMASCTATVAVFWP